MSASTTTFSWDKATWAPLTEMADGFDEYRPAHSTALAGKKLVLDAHFVDGGDTFTLTQDFTATDLDYMRMSDEDIEKAIAELKEALRKSSSP